jgi:L-fuconolactonase
MIDAHIHFWDPRRLHYDWLPPALDRPFLPPDVGAEGFVFVQADCRDDEAWAEVDWVTGLAAEHPILGIVAYAAPELDRLAAHPLVVGVRKLLQGEPDAFLASDALAARVDALAEHGLTFDACVTHEQLPFVTRLAARCPDTTIVLDHLGKPDVKHALLDPWRAQLAALAEHPNVVCKLSGLTTEADHERWTAADVRPYLEHALARFGEERCLFGSDWPVATLATSYERWRAVVLDLLPAAVLSANAARVYGLRRGATASQPHPGRDRSDQGDDRPRGAQAGGPAPEGE